MQRSVQQKKVARRPLLHCAIHQQLVSQTALRGKFLTKLRSVTAPLAIPFSIQYLLQDVDVLINKRVLNEVYFTFSLDRRMLMSSLPLFIQSHFTNTEVLHHRNCFFRNISAACHLLYYLFNVWFHRSARIKRL